jgi:hypothetical protein
VRALRLIRGQAVDLARDGKDRIDAAYRFGDERCLGGIGTMRPNVKGLGAF